MSASWRANTETLTASCPKLSNDKKPQSKVVEVRARIVLSEFLTADPVRIALHAAHNLVLLSSIGQFQAAFMKQPSGNLSDLRSTY